MLGEFMPTVVDLFSGCGGMSWGLQRAGFSVMGALDNDPRVLATYQHNHPDATVVQADIRDLSPHHFMDTLNLAAGELDCLVGGPPCQGFSKNVPASYRFFDDPRNQLYLDFLTYAEVIRPKTLVIENVAEIYNAYDGIVRNEIVDTLAAMGYAVAVKVLLAADYGVPQRRRRCIFLASRTGNLPVFPAPTHSATGDVTLFETILPYQSAWSAMSDLPVLENGDGYEPMLYDQPAENDYQRLMRAESGAFYDHVTRELNEKQFSRLLALQPGQGIKDLPDPLRPRSGYSGAYGRLDYEMVAPTITRWVFHPGSGRYGHPREVRLITIREAARLQSFSDDFRFLGTYIQKAHQLGNAVPPLLMTALAPAITDCLYDPSAV